MVSVFIWMCFLPLFFFIFLFRPLKVAFLYLSFLFPCSVHFGLFRKNVRNFDVKRGLHCLQCNEAVKSTSLRRRRITNRRKHLDLTQMHQLKAIYFVFLVDSCYS